MDFISCKREPHKDWGVNDPINLEHVVTYGAGTVRPRPNSTRSEAPAIVFTTVRGLPVTWSFVDERHRDWELGRLTELTYVPKDQEVLAALMSDKEPA